MPAHDLTIRHGTVVNASGTSRVDVGIADGRIVTLAEHLLAGSRDIDATGRLRMVRIGGRVPID